MKNCIYGFILAVSLAAVRPGRKQHRCWNSSPSNIPTLVNFGFEWAISGDTNRNATVAVKFRQVGESGWHEALPLMRIGGESVYRRRENLDYTVPEGFAGSILNLKPGTEYEWRFSPERP